MMKTYNVIVEVTANYVNTVKATTMAQAWDKATTNTNSFTTQPASHTVDLIEVTGEKMSFRWCDNEFEIEEVYEEDVNEYKACGTLELVIMTDIKAESFNAALKYCEETFNDCYLTLPDYKVVNHEMDEVTLSIADYEIGIGSIERVYGEDSENNEKSVAL